MPTWNRRTKKDKITKQNRPDWKKIRSWGRKLVRDKHGQPARDAHGKIRLENVKIKTSEYEKVNVV